MKVIGIWRGGFAYHTTKIVGIENPDLDTLSENKRVVVTLQSDPLGIFHVVFVGGPLIGSMVLNVEVGQSIKRGSEMARFEYGGSAIYSKLTFHKRNIRLSFMESSYSVVCFPAGFSQIQWNVPMNEVLENSVEVQLRSTVGKVSLSQ